MKHNTKKGFTLVELLVVIAILAILATVSVVGYTSFIDSANRAVDDQTVSQLNHFLTAYMSNHKSTYYGQPITEENGRKIVLEVLELSGLGEITTVTADKGNYIYLDVNKGEFVLASEDEAMPSAGARFFASLRALLKAKTLNSEHTIGQHASQIPDMYLLTQQVPNLRKL